MIGWKQTKPQTIDVMTLIFSSPEHEVLKVSYCDQSLSVVRPSDNNCLKNISSETTKPDSLKLYRKFHCMTPWPTLLDLCL